MTCQPETNTVATTPATSTPENIAMTQHATSQTGSTSIPNCTLGAATAMICNAIAAAADQISEALRDTGRDNERTLDAIADKLGELGEAIKGVDDELNWVGMRTKDGCYAISESLDHIARDIRTASAEAIEARAAELLVQRHMAAQISVRRTAKPCRNRSDAR